MVEAIKKPSLNDVFSLKQLCKQKLSDAIQQIRAKHNSETKSFLFVLDNQTMRIVSSCLQMYEIMELDLNIQQLFDAKRKPFPKTSAIYFITPSEDSIKRMLQDYPKKKAIYGNVHLLFSSAVSETLMKSIADNDELIARVQSCKEINLEFMVSDRNNFTFDLPQCLPLIYGQDNAAMMIKAEEGIANKLFTLVSTFEQINEIEILHLNNQYSSVSQSVAQRLHDATCNYIKQLKQQQAENDNENKNTLNSQAGKVTVLIVERSLDAVTPILHDFIYQPLIFDVFGIKNNVFRSPGKEKGSFDEVLLEAQDQVFSNYRLLPIQRVLEVFNTDFKDVLNKNQAIVKMRDSEAPKDKKIQVINDAVKSFGVYSKIINQFKLHIYFLESLQGKDQMQLLNELGELEQSLATGLDELGKEASISSMIKKVGILLSQKLDQQQRNRLIFITWLCLDLSPQDALAISSYLSNDDKEVMHHLHRLGLSPPKAKGSTTLRVDKQRKIMAQQKFKTKNMMMALSRHTSVLSTLAEHLLKAVSENQKCTDVKLQFMPQESSGKLVSLNICATNQGGQKKNMQTEKSPVGKKLGMIGQSLGKKLDDAINMVHHCDKFVVFMVGGISYSEICELQNLSQSGTINLQNTVFIIGSTSFTNPEDYLDSIRLINKKVSL